MRRADGTGKPLDPEASYYIQDCRTIVGNCAQWWRPEAAGYCCDVSDAGVYSGAFVAGLSRDTDVAWPVSHVEALVVRHVRADILEMIARWVCACGCGRTVHPFAAGTIGWRGDWYTAECYARLTGRPTDAVGAVLDALSRKPVDEDGEVARGISEARRAGR